MAISIKGLGVAIALSVLATCTIGAKANACTYDNNGRVICMGGAQQVKHKRALKRAAAIRKPHARAVKSAVRLAASKGAASRPTQAHVGAGRPAGCPHAWCGCWLAQKFGFAGSKARELWLARNWLQFPHTSPKPGAVAVLKRGRGGHVGIVQAVDPNGNPVILSGNHNNRVGVGTYPRGRVLAYVEPQ